jgi:hypothetical protein
MSRHYNPAATELTIAHVTCESDHFLLIDGSVTVAVPLVPECRELILKFPPIHRELRLQHLAHLILRQPTVAVDVDRPKPTCGVSLDRRNGHDTVVLGAANWAGLAAVMASNERLAAGGMEEVPTNAFASSCEHCSRLLAERIAADATLCVFHSFANVAWCVHRHISWVKLPRGGASTATRCAEWWRHGGRGGRRVPVGGGCVVIQVVRAPFRGHLDLPARR